MNIELILLITLVVINGVLVIIQAPIAYWSWQIRRIDKKIEKLKSENKSIDISSQKLMSK